MKSQLKILMIVNMPWKRELGAARVSIELAEELRNLGHTVDKFDIDDALRPRNKLTSFFKAFLFCRKAIHYVRTNGYKYDIIQAEEGILSVSKKSLNFSGVLIARSNGLRHMYRDYLLEYKKTHANAVPKGTFIGSILRWISSLLRDNIKCIEKSFESADGIILINKDEVEYVSQNLGHQEKSFLVPNGLSEARFDEFSRQSVEPQQRAMYQRVVFIGSWGYRKGSNDFPAIVREVRRQIPAAKFLFLGVGVPKETLLVRFEEQDSTAIDVVPFFNSEELPGLLRTSTVSVLPSYIEGFGIGVLESLASGIPAITYDVPGPREMLHLLDENLLIERGDVLAFANKTAEILNLSPHDYSALSKKSVEVARHFRWKDIVVEMLKAYKILIERL